MGSNLGGNPVHSSCLGISWQHFLFSGARCLIHQKGDSICDYFQVMFFPLAPESCFIISVCQDHFLPHCSLVCHVCPAGMPCDALCAVESRAIIPRGQQGPLSRSGTVRSRAESATSHLLFWASISLFGKWRCLNLKSTGLFLR